MVPIKPAQLVIDTLRITTEHEDASLCERWGQVDHRGVAELMKREGGELWLHRRLMQIGAHDTPLAHTPFWRKLEKAAKKSVAQNLLVQTHAEFVASLLSGAGIPHRPIKGVARQAVASIFPFANCRATRDVDLIVPQNHATDAWDCLVAAGYHQSSDLTPEDHFHLPPLANDEAIAVEIHTSTSSRVTPHEAWERATKPDDATEVLWQGIAHAMDQGLEAFFLRYYLDAAVALNKPAGIDWDVVRQRLHSDEISDFETAIKWLLTAACFTASNIPTDLTTHEAAIPLLRTGAWRLTAYRSRFRNRSWTRKLLAEALRSEFDMDIEGPVPATPWTHKVRRTTSAAAARITYRAWKKLRWPTGVN